jgi:SAM-dependent methyltransferase
MRLWQIEELLKDIKSFEKPDVYLEQYATPPHIAAYLVHIAENSFGDLQGKLVADLGCGTGMLCAAVLYLESRYCSLLIKNVQLLNECSFSYIVGVDVDDSALAVSSFRG